MEDFEDAIHAWTRAIELAPRNYIYRRRLQQYGPRLEKPYAFYDWIATARKELLAAGEKPAALVLEPEGSEIAGRLRAKLADASSGSFKAPDPGGKLPRDEAGLVRVKAIAAPTSIYAGMPLRAYVHLDPSGAKKAHFDPEAGGVTLWLELEDGLRAEKQRIEIPVQKGKGARVDFELLLPDSAKKGKRRIAAYACYYVCEDVTGTCSYLRQDFEIEVNVKGPKPKRRAGRSGRRRRR